MSYLCKMETLPTDTDAKLKLINPSNYAYTTPATVDDVDKTSITFTNKENLQNYLSANCVKTDSLVPEGNGGAGIMSFILLILLIASVVYLMMPRGNTGNNSFGLAKSSFTF